MQPEQRTFVRIDEETWIERSDFEARQPGREPPRTSTTFAVFFPDLAAAALRSRVLGCRYVDVVESLKPPAPG